MESLKDFKDWILKKRYSPESNDTRNTLHAGITPNSIPEFVIPGSVEAMRSDNTECYEGGPSYRMSQKRNSIATSSPKHTGHVPLPRTQSDQMSLNEDVKFTLLYRDKTRSLGYLESLPRQTNADPLSKAAVSLPHFRSKTSYGFTTLNQPPHTKRKESLFHSGCNGFISNEDLTRLLVIESLKQKCKSSENFTNVCVENTSTPTVVVSAPALADNSLNRETVCTSHLSPPKPNYQRKRKGKTEHYFRRRSSLLGTDCSSVSSEDSIIHELEFEGQLTPSPSGSLRLEGSTPSFQLEESILSQVSTGRCHAESGEIKFAFQFLAASKMFKVTIIRAENLGGVNRIDPCINSYCKVCLTPGKYQRQTNIVKQNKNPIYNQELAFNSLSLKQLHLMLLDIKIFHKERYQKHPEYLGKISVNLENYDLMTENRMWKEIDSKREREDLGSIGVSLLFQPRDCNIYVFIRRARDLPWHHTGPPDPYVKIELRQPGRSVSRKHTKLVKKSSNPDFDEQFKFSISPKFDDMAYTNIVISLYNHEKLKSDELIGQIRLGVDGLQKTEIELWEKCINTPGTEVSDRVYLQNQDFI